MCPFVRKLVCLEITSLWRENYLTIVCVYYVVYIQCCLELWALQWRSGSHHHLTARRFWFQPSQPNGDFMYRMQLAFSLMSSHSLKICRLATLDHHSER